MSFGKLCPFSIDANVLKLDQCDSNSESALASKYGYQCNTNQHKLMM